MLARDLPKLLVGTRHHMTLIDGDTVEEKNVKRQSYQTKDVGENKAVVLAAKINSFYETKCYAYDHYITKSRLQQLIESSLPMLPVVIGCVDNDATRKEIEGTLEDLGFGYYLDSANSEYTGDVYISRFEKGGVSGALRSRTYQLEDDQHPLAASCEEQAARGNVQYLVTNAKMSIVLLEHIHALLNNELKVGVSVVKRFKTVHYD